MNTATLKLAKSKLAALDQYMSDSDYTGPDPYDGLNSKLSRFAKTKLSRQLLIQGNKRSPLELRPLLGIPPIQMSKTLGLVLSSHSVASTELQFSNNRLEEIISCLLSKRNNDGAWGYEFDVQMRWGQYFKDSSNIIATSFAVDGLDSLELDELALSNWKESVANWICTSLEHDNFITYAASSDRLIHNANLLGAVTLEICRPGEQLVKNALHRSLEAQHANGSFPYGDEKRTEWVDSFHTAYVLLALNRLAGVYPEALEPLEKGLEFWVQHFFDSNFRAKYFHNDAKSTDDVHTNATTLLTLATFSNLPKVQQVFEQFLEDYLKRLNSHGFYTNRKHGKAFMRWELAHQLRALAETVKCIQ